jgi:predicted membrane metal-binding protein
MKSGTDFQTLLLWTSPLHGACTSYLDSRGFHAIYKGLLCGDSHMPASTETLFKQTGLFHLLIVSGSHFIFLDQAWNLFFKKYRKTKIAFFIVFAAICQFQPPVVRALCSLLAQATSRRLKLFWRSEQIALYSGLWCLILFPEWWISHSLLLSWLASLALCFSRKTIYQHVLIFFFISPILFNSSFYSVLNNLIFAPVFAFFYFPMTVATALLPYSPPLGNFLWRITFSVMSYLPTEGSHPLGFSPLLPFTLLWIYIFALHLLKRGLRYKETV